MENVKKAVSKANSASEREGKWSNKPEISKKIVGRKPASLSKTLSELVKDDKIEKKPRAQLWRIEKSAGGGGGGKKSGRIQRGGKDEREPTRRSPRRTSGRTPTRRTTRRTERKESTTGRRTRDMVTGAVAAVIVGGAASSTRSGSPGIY